MIYCNYMQETVDRKVSPEEEAPTSDTRGNYPNRAHFPQAYLAHEPDEDYPGPSFLYDGLVAEATAPRAPKLRLTTSGGRHWAMAYCTLAPVIGVRAISSTWPQQLGLVSPQQ